MGMWASPFPSVSAGGIIARHVLGRRRPTTWLTMRLGSVAELVFFGKLRIHPAREEENSYVRDRIGYRIEWWVRFSPNPPKGGV